MCFIIEELLSVATGVIITEVTHLSDMGLIQRTVVVTSMCEREMTKSYRAFDSYPDIDLSLLPENRAELKNFYYGGSLVDKVNDCGWVWPLPVAPRCVQSVSHPNGKLVHTMAKSWSLEQDRVERTPFRQPLRWQNYSRFLGSAVSFV